MSPSSSTVIQCHLGEFQPSPFLVRNNITVPVKKGSRWYGWLTTGETSCKNSWITYFNDSIYNSILDGGCNTCDIIAITSIERTFGNDHIHVLHDIPKRYIYGYLISKLISSEAKIPDHDITNNLFTPDLRWCKINKINK